jgi:hypothetical protein
MRESTKDDTEWGLKLIGSIVLLMYVGIWILGR